MKKHLLPMAAMLILGLTARAADGDTFTVDNINYTVLSETEHSVEISRSYITGELELPSEINYNGSRYFVTAIGVRAFGSCSGLTSVTIPNSVTEIGEGAFSYCSSLTSVTIPNSVTAIGELAFYECSNLTSVTIPNSVTAIGTGSFSYCSSLTGIAVDAENKNYLSNDGVLYTKDMQTLHTFPGGKGGEFTIPNSVTAIGGYAFSGCMSLTLVTIPNSVTAIGGDAFSYCMSLTSVTIPNSVTAIGANSFSGCFSLTGIAVDAENKNYLSNDGVLYTKDMQTLHTFPGGKGGEFTIPNSVTEIGESAFYGCSGLTSVTIPNSVTAIGDEAFGNCSGLTSVPIPNSVTEIGGWAFFGCSGLTSVTIPNSVTTIGNVAFASCNGLTSLTIGNSVTAIGGSAFANCMSLKTIYALPAVPPYINQWTFDYVPADAVVYVPKGTSGEYSSDDGWAYFTDFREMGALDISLSASAISLKEGESETLTATVVKDDDVTIESESWTSSDPGVATVDGGTVTAVAGGKATVTYTVVDGYGLSHTGSCEVEVTGITGIESIGTDNCDAPAEYYNLNGIRVNAGLLAPGLYIRRQGGKATKILVK